MSSSEGWSNGSPKIGIIGAGMSGLCAAVQLRKKLAITSFTIFEKNADVGGVWLKNTYPGCACDTASHLYSFSSELNPNWSENYASQPEILDYVKDVARKYKLYEHIKCQHEVKSCTWNDDLNKWTVCYVNASIPNADDETQLFDIIITATGAFRIPHIPDEFKAFTGPAMHTAEWNHKIDLKNKKVAVVGSGASAVQVIPSVIDDVRSLHCYQRRPAYILPRAQFVFPIFLKKIFFYIPFIMWLYRCVIYIQHELLYKAFHAGSLLNKFAHRLTKRYRRRELMAHRHLWNDLTPKYSFGCKRVMVSEKYYAAITRPNLRIHSSHIDKIVDQTIYTKDGTKEEIDVLILATGFNVHDYHRRMKIFGKCGQNVLQNFAEDPRSYYGIVFSATPNLFALQGPNTGLGHNSVLFMIECQVNFLVNAIREMMHQSAKVINVKVSAEDEFMDKLKRDMKSTVWVKEDCGSWYVNARGVITTLWGSNSINYWRQTRIIDWAKFDIK